MGTRPFGITRIEDLRNYDSQEIGVEVLRDAIRIDSEAYNQEVNALLAAWCEDTTAHSVVVRQPTGGTLQPLGEMSIPAPSKLGGSWSQGIPIYGAGDAYADTYLSRARMKPEIMIEHVQSIQRRDADWIRRQFLASVLTEDAYAFVDLDSDNPTPDTTVLPFANGDSVEYLLDNNTTATDDHYLAQAAAIDDANDPFLTIYDELDEHPENNVDDDNPIMVFIPKNLRTSVTDLTNFVGRKSANIEPSDDTNRAMANMSLPFGRGMKFLGYYEGLVGEMHIYQWNALPSGYMFATASGAGKFMFRRQFPEAELQGLFLKNLDMMGFVEQHNWIRWMGMAVKHRTAGLGYYVGGAAWVNPTGLTQILPH